MKNKTKKLFFKYIGVSVLAVITPIAIICGTSYHTNKIANSKQTNRTINRVSKVPNFVNASLYQNTNYGTSTITIPFSYSNSNIGTYPANNITLTSPTNINEVNSNVISSFLQQIEINVFSNNLEIPQDINFSGFTPQLTGSLGIEIQSFCSGESSSSGSTPTNNECFNFDNNQLNYSINNYFNGEGAGKG
ncbi:hypothetical protein J6P52_06805 [bacterium]|nr:hypothetical protein [bacterium]